MAPPTPAPQPSATPVISSDATEDPAPQTEPAILGSQTDVTVGASAQDKGEPSSGNDPSAEVFAENLLSNPGLAKFGLTRKSAEEIQRVARQVLDKSHLSPEEEAQEAEDVKFSDLLTQVRLHDERIRTGELPTAPVIPLTLAEKVAAEVNAGLDKLTREQYVSRNSNSCFFHYVISYPLAPKHEVGYRIRVYASLGCQRTN